MEERKEQAGEPGEEPTDGDLAAPDESPAADTPPAVPSDDDSALGDTDQHSDA
jgi:hypothetical protein